MFRDIAPVLPVADSPTLAYEVIDYVVSIGTVRTEVGGASCGEVRVLSSQRTVTKLLFDN
jgi:hypothetical protein